MKENCVAPWLNVRHAAVVYRIPRHGAKRGGHPIKIHLRGPLINSACRNNMGSFCQNMSAFLAASSP